MDKVRVLRIIEYSGPREAIEQQVARSIHGTRSFDHRLGEVTIRVATIGSYPEVLEEDESGPRDWNEVFSDKETA